MPTTRENYVFFWRETAEHGWASQWYPCLFRARKQLRIGPHFVDSECEYDFPTAEHWMMACKAALFGDEEVLQEIFACGAYDTREVKALGRSVRGFEETVWNAARETVVVQGNLHKFSQSEELRAALLETGDKMLVEASPRDRIWGIGFGEKRALEVKERWGLNLLGKALEEVREIFRRGELELPAGGSEAAAV